MRNLLTIITSLLKISEQFDLWFFSQVICVTALSLFFLGFTAVCVNDNHLFFTLLCGEIMMFGLCLLALVQVFSTQSAFAVVFAMCLLGIAAIDSAIGLSFTLLFFLVSQKS